VTIIHLACLSEETGRISCEIVDEMRSFHAISFSSKLELLNLAEVKENVIAVT